MSTTQLHLSEDTLKVLVTRLAWDYGVAADFEPSETGLHIVRSHFRCADVKCEHHWALPDLRRCDWAVFVADTVRRIAFKMRAMLTAEAMAKAYDRRITKQSVLVNLPCGCIMNITFKEAIDGRWVDLAKDGFMTINTDLCKRCSEAKKLAAGEVERVASEETRT